MKTLAKKFKKSGFEGIWRVESMTLDVFELHSDPDTGRDVPHLLRSKQFTNGRVAESYFMDKVKAENKPRLQFADTGDEDHLT
jgi:hypothetical protein